MLGCHRGGFGGLTFRALALRRSEWGNCGSLWFIHLCCFVQVWTSFAPFFLTQLRCQDPIGPLKSLTINFHLHLHKCHLLHNLHAMEENLHRGNREETGRPLPQTPTRRRTKQHRCVQTSRAPFQSSQSLPPQHDYLRTILTPREHRKLQKSRTKIHFSTGYTLSTRN